MTAVEAGLLPLNMAMETAKSEDDDVQRALTQGMHREEAQRQKDGRRAPTG